MFRCILTILISLLILTLGKTQGEIIRCGVNGSLPRLEFNKTAFQKSGTDLVVPVVFHVVWFDESENIPQEILEAQLKRINDDFGGKNIDITKVPDEFFDVVGRSDIRFCFAEQDPEGNAHSGIVRVKTDIEKIGGTPSPIGDTRNPLKHSDLGGSSAWDTDRYLNIWISARGDGIIGLATFPNIDGEQNLLNEDGVALRYDVVGPSRDAHPQFNHGRTLTHELGHYFGLYHLWGRDTISCDYEIGDEVDDTPVQGTSYFNCVEGPVYSCESQDMPGNFMNFSDDVCMFYFTEGQVNRMEATLQAYRSTLLGQVSCQKDSEMIVNPFERIIITQQGNSLQFNLVELQASDYQIALYDITGRLLWRATDNDLRIHYIDNLRLNAGVYFVTYQQEGNIYVKKVFYTYH